MSVTIIPLFSFPVDLLWVIRTNVIFEKLQIRLIIRIISGNPISLVFQGGYLEHIFTFAAREASCNLLVFRKIRGSLHS